jgi:hypothetical protein
MKKINTLINSEHTPRFGNFILFQEYVPNEIDNNISYEVTRPILAVVLDIFTASQTIGFHYIRYIPDFSKSMFNTPKVESHIEWNEYIDILGLWTHKPSFKEYRDAARNRERKNGVDDMLTEDLYLPVQANQISTETIDINEELYGDVWHDVVSNSFHMNHLIIVKTKDTHLAVMAVADEAVLGLDYNSYMLCKYNGIYEGFHTNYGQSNKLDVNTFISKALEIINETILPIH